MLRRINEPRVKRKTVPKPPPLPANASAGRKWRFRRDLVIYLAYSRNGLSQRFLADVFDLPRSRIATIVRNFSRFESSHVDDFG